MERNIIFQNAEFFENFIDYTISGISVFDFDPILNDFRLVFGNKAFYDHNLFLPKDSTGKPYLDIFPMSKENGMYDKVHSVYKTGESVSFTLSYYNIIRGNVCQIFQLIRISDRFVVAIFNDISEIQNTSEQIKLEQIKYSQTLNSLNVGVITTDQQKRITLINKYAYNMLELESTESVIGQLIDDLYRVEKSTSNKMMHELVDGFDAQTIICSNGVKKLVVHRVSPLVDENGKNHGYVYSFDDVSSFVKTQEELMFINYHDVHTKFYNRYFLKIFLANNPLKSGMGVIYADINGLSRINDTMGSNVGDDVLKTCALIFQAKLADDTIFVRFGEDDFIALVYTTPETNLQELSMSISNDFAQACRYANTTLAIGTSMVGVDAHDLSDAIHVAQNKMNSQKVMNIQSIRSSALLSLLATLQVKSHETEEHAQRLNDISQAFAKKLHLDEKDLNHLALLSVLHDVGKIGVPEFVLNKPGKLTEEEWKIMKNHSNLGYKITVSTPELETVSSLVRAHHERWDGTGYPDGLKGEDIPLLARIISIVDTYDAMISDRVYRKGLPKEKAIEEIERCSGSQFDPSLVPVFVETIKELDAQGFSPILDPLDV